MAYSELQAVNIVLQQAGEAPISTFSDEGANELSQSGQARALLAEISQTVQSQGWSWNTMRNVTLEPNGQGQFPVPETYLLCEFQVAMSQRKYQQRGNRIFDSLNNTYTIDAKRLCADRVIEFLEWDLVPATAQYYIIHMTANRYVMRLLNNELLLQQTALEMEEAYKRLQQDEHRRAPSSMLWDTGQPDTPYNIGAVPARGMRNRRGA